jgi:transposase InsO family protein
LHPGQDHTQVQGDDEFCASAAGGAQSDCVGLLASLVVHSDRGSQYCGHLFQSALKGYGMKSSMSRKGDRWDNPPIKSLWVSMKRACIYGHRFTTREEAKAAVMN